MAEETLSKWYEERRNELLALLGEATVLEIPNEYADELHATAQKCQENSFEIALVGEFQGGKSTTFNALCDGRDISQRGLGGGGIKTSAAKISAQNIANDETRQMPDGTVLHEWAEVSYKAPRTIVLAMATLLRPVILDDEKLNSEFEALFTSNHNLPEDQKFENLILTDDGFSSLVDLDNNSHREILQKAASILWAQWNDKAQRRKMKTDNLDQLRIATLLLRFYGTEEWKCLTAQTLLPINQFQKYIAFPKDWAKRWNNGEQAEFSLEEIAFVFIHSVLVRLHSANLQRLGCRITDCPGFFANAFDTQIAMQTIQQADAIWYLINGDKQIGEKDLEIIQKIAEVEMLGKTEATCNLRGSHEQKIEEVLPVTKEILNSQGHDLEVLPYNARLAFLSMQGNILLNHRESFSELDEQNMRVDAPEKARELSPEEMWTKMVQRVGISTELGDIETIEELNQDALDTTRKCSFFDTILTSLEDSIIPQKAKSILIDKGSERAIKALKAFEGKLWNNEKDAQENRDKRLQEWKDARKHLLEFIASAKKILNESDLGTAKKRQELAERIALDIVTLTVNDIFLDKLASDFGTVLADIDSRFFIKQSTLEQRIMELLVPKVVNDYKAALTRGLDQWKKGNGYNSIKLLRDIVKRICDDFQRAWEKHQLSADTIFTGIKPPTIPDTTVSDLCNDLSSILLDNKTISTLAEKARPGFWSGLGTILSWITLWRPAVKLKDWLKNDTNFNEKGEAQRAREEKKAKEYAEKLKPELEKELKNIQELKKLAVPIASELYADKGAITVILQSLSDQLVRIKDSFEENVSNSQAVFYKSDKERQQIANENRLLRTEKIEPLRKRIEEFQQTVIEKLG